MCCICTSEKSQNVWKRRHWCVVSVEQSIAEYREIETIEEWDWKAYTDQREEGVHYISIWNRSSFSWSRMWSETTNIRAFRNGPLHILDLPSDSCTRSLRFSLRIGNKINQINNQHISPVNRVCFHGKIPTATTATFTLNSTLSKFIYLNKLYTVVINKNHAV